MTQPQTPDDRHVSDDVRTLEAMGYKQQLSRTMRGFSSFAMSLSIICILAGGVTSFQLGFNGVGGAAIGLGWPLACAFSLVVAAAMAQTASAFPTAGGLYHWASILGGRGWGWVTAWFNLIGLVTVLAAINVGTYQFARAAFFPNFPQQAWLQFAAVAAITVAQGLCNHWGIRLTSKLTDFSGYWILAVSALIAALLLWHASTWDFGRLISFENFSGLPEGTAVWPQSGSLTGLFLAGLLLPAYTITGFDASAHTAEETVDAAVQAPRGIVRSVMVSGAFGWLMLSAVVLAMPDLRSAAERGDQAFSWTMQSVVSAPLAHALCGAIVVAQLLCGLATVTSASRMAFAFARDGGLPWSNVFAAVSRKHRTPAAAVWLVAVASVAFTIYTPVYATITAVCTIFLYVSYVLPAALGFFAYGKKWRHMGPWRLGRWYRPAAAVSVVGCAGLIAIGMQPPNERAAYVLVAACVVLGLGWGLHARRTFPGPPAAVIAYMHGGSDD